MKYRILLHPNHARTFFDKSGTLALAEWEAARGQLSAPPENGEIISAAGHPWLRFTMSACLTERDLAVLGDLSFTFLVFQAGEADSAALTPLDTPAPLMTPDMAALLKYTGKTNETFTRLLVNAARFAASGTGKASIVLDPLCGKATTLYCAAMLGLDGIGVEQHAGDVHDAAVFTKKYLEEAGCKHSVQTETLRDRDNRKTGEGHIFRFSPDKDRWKAGEHQSLRLLTGDTRLCDHWLKRNAADCIVTDLPYGVQHAANTAGRAAASSARREGPSRAPLILLQSALPHWRAALRPGGAMALGWNVHVLRRAALEETLRGNGFAVLPPPPGLETAHRVSQAIDRDYLVCIREG